jgi:hypothetical protein
MVPQLLVCRVSLKGITQQTSVVLKLPAPLLIKRNRFVSLCGVAVYGTPQDWLWRRLLFGEAWRFGVYVVAIAISPTCHTWLHAESGGMWMWRHVLTAFFGTRIQ